MTRGRSPIREGETFSYPVDGGRVVCRRESDDPAPAFACERMRVTVLEQPLVIGHRPYTFGAEPAWFRERGLAAESAAPTRRRRRG